MRSGVDSRVWRAEHVMVIRAFVTDAHEDTRSGRSTNPYNHNFTMRYSADQSDPVSSNGDEGGNASQPPVLLNIRGAFPSHGC